MDDLAKTEYKPGYVSNLQDELGDVWYYIRILYYIKKIDKPIFSFMYSNEPIEDIVAGACLSACTGYLLFVKEYLDTDVIHASYSALVKICNQINITLDDLTQSNWEKLKPGSERGEQWRKASERQL